MSDYDFDDLMTTTIVSMIIVMISVIIIIMNIIMIILRCGWTQCLTWWRICNCEMSQ